MPLNTVTVSSTHSRRSRQAGACRSASRWPIVGCTSSAGSVI